MEFREARSFTDFETPELQEVAHDCGCALYTRHFAVVDGGVEMAFIALDFFPLEQPIVLYSLYVVRSYRGRGIGSRVLAEVENLAKRKGYKSLILKPKPLDEAVSRERLINWYTRCGYDWRDADREILKKNLVPRQTEDTLHEGI